MRWKSPVGRALTSFPEGDLQITSESALLIAPALAYTIYVL